MTIQDRKHIAAKAAHSAAETIKGTAAEIKGTAVDALYTATCGVEAVAEGAAATAIEAASALRDEAVQKVKAGKDMIAEQGERLVSGLRDFVGDHGDGALQTRLLAMIAGSVSDVSESLRGRSLGALWQDAGGYARRNPKLVLAGAALAGFALTRVAVASSRAAASEPSARKAVSAVRKAGRAS